MVRGLKMVPLMFPRTRLRRLRSAPWMRDLVRETRLDARCLVAPLFVVPGRDTRREIPSLPGHFHLSPDAAEEEAARLADLGIPAVLLFGQAERKDPAGRGADGPGAAVPAACAAIKKRLGARFGVIADVCLCAYTDHGHCGVRDAGGAIDNDRSIARLAEIAVAYARAGADVVAPSDMMDGRVAAIRGALDAAGLPAVAILSYAAKYASAFYGPFREAAASAPPAGEDRASYQMSPAQGREALREIEADLAEGADMVMVKPALAYLDVIRAARARIDAPLVAYSVSGEYACVKAAAARGWIDEKAAALEILTAIRRAGADAICTYWAAWAAREIR